MDTNAVDWVSRLKKSPDDMTKDELAVWAMGEFCKLEEKVARQSRVIRQLRNNLVELRGGTVQQPKPQYDEKFERNLAIAKAATEGTPVAELAATAGVTQSRIRGIARKYGKWVRCHG